MLCAGVLAGYQVTTWLQNDIWDNVPISSMMKRLKRPSDATYVRGELERTERSLEDKHFVINQLLEIPTIVPLLIASALLLGFCIWLNSITKSAN